MTNALTIDQALQQAVDHHMQGQLQEAEELYRAILQVQPSHPDANNNLGVLAVQLNQPAVSLPYFKAAVEANPTQGQYWKRYIDALIQADQIDDARDMLEQGRQQGLQGEELDALIVRLEDGVQTAGQLNTEDDKEAPPVSSAVMQNNKKKSKTKPDKSVKKSSLLKGKNPSQQEINALVALLSKGRYPEALTLAQNMTIRFPQHGFGWKVLGALFQQMGRSADALKPMQKAAALLPDDAETHNNLGAILKDMGRADEAVRSYRRALEIMPDYAPAHFNLGIVLSDLGRQDEADLSYRRALEIKPDYAEAHTNLLFSLSHNESVDAEALFSAHCRFGEQIERPFRSHCLQHANSPNPGRTLQIGFVSGDFWNHAVANFIEPVLAHLSNYPQLSLHAYYNNDIEDAITQRIKGHFAYWHSIVGLDDATLAEKIQADGIDILIDLSGHTTKNRLTAFARKPAPVQASWMGYPGTTGLQAMDYYFADRFFLPLGQFDDQFTERLVYLPAGAPFKPYNEAPSVNSLPALNNGFVTFGSFNRLSKLSPSVIALWAQLLRALPDSKIVLGAMPQDGYDEVVGWFTQEGIDRERLSFHTKCGMGAYLALHHQVDICLDTFPYNGGTTTCHALWMGVPTLTLAGYTPSARAGAAILGHAGLEEFVAHDTEDFVSKGMAWAKNIDALALIRMELRRRFEQSGMGRPALIAAGVERALRIMWQRWCDGLPPAVLDVSDAQINCAKHEDDQ